MGYPSPPAASEPGESRSFALPLGDQQMQWGEHFVRDFVGSWPRVGVHLIQGFFVNGVRHDSPYGVATLDAAIDRALLEAAA